jgi:hypothetical protein
MTLPQFNEARAEIRALPETCRYRLAWEEDGRMFSADFPHPEDAFEMRAEFEQAGVWVTEPFPVRRGA